MNWDQIENKWMAMARRVRPDWPAATIPHDPSRLQMARDVSPTAPAPANGPGLIVAQDVDATPVRFE